MEGATRERSYRLTHFGFTGVNYCVYVIVSEVACDVVHGLDESVSGERDKGAVRVAAFMAK